jgi:hypothetical protein
MKFEKAKNLNYLLNILDLKNQKYVRKNSFNSNKIKSFKTHKLWFCNYIKENKLYILKKKERFVGYIRIDKKNSSVSWAIYKKFWGKVNFYKILKKLTKKKHIAKIKNTNQNSIISAIKAGFVITSVSNGIIKLKK